MTNFKDTGATNQKNDDHSYVCLQDAYAAFMNSNTIFFFFNQTLMMQRHLNQGNSGIWQAGKEKCNTMPLQTAVGIGARLLQTFSFCPHLMVPLNTMAQYQPRQQNLQHTN